MDFQRRVLDLLHSRAVWKSVAGRRLIVFRSLRVKRKWRNRGIIELPLVWAIMDYRASPKEKRRPKILREGEKGRDKKTHVVSWSHGGRLDLSEREGALVYAVALGGLTFDLRRASFCSRCSSVHWLQRTHFEGKRHVMACMHHFSFTTIFVVHARSWVKRKGHLIT